jgi:hypothetical protein
MESESLNYFTRAILINDEEQIEQFTQRENEIQVYDLNIDFIFDG